MHYKIKLSTYFDLFNSIGILHGQGNGTTTFNVPDLRGRGMFGYVGSTNGLITLATADQVGLGGKGGEETHVLTTNEMPSHSHIFNNYTASGSIQGPLFTTGSYISGQQTLETGGGASHNNMPPFLLMNFIIKT